MATIDKIVTVFNLTVSPEGRKGKPVDLTEDLLSFKYEDSEGKADKVELTIDNHTLKYLDDETFRKGNILDITFGYPGNTCDAKNFVIKSVKGDHMEMHIEGVFKSYLLHQQRKSRSFENMSRSGVAAKLAEEWGYGSDSQDIQDSVTKYASIPQGGKTDAEFLKDQAKRIGYEFWIDGTGFHFHPRRFKQAPKKKLKWYTDNTGEMIAFEFSSDAKGKHGRVVAKGRDPITKKSFEADAKNDTTKRESLGALLEVVDEKTGQTSMQKRTAHEELVPSSAASAKDGKAHADGLYTNSQQRNFYLTLTLVGDPELRAKQVIEVAGIGRRLSGLWYVRKALHELSPDSYETRLECVRDGHNGYNGTSKDAKSKGDVNDKKAKEVLEEVNERTGETKITWKKN